MGWLLVVLGVNGESMIWQLSGSLNVSLDPI